MQAEGQKPAVVPLRPAVIGLVTDYLDTAGHGDDDGGALFHPLHHSPVDGAAQAITPDGVYRIVRGYSAALGFEIGAHALRTTAATNSLDHQAAMQGCAHSNVSIPIVGAVSRPPPRSKRNHQG